MTARRLLRGARALIGAHPVVFGLLVLWTLAPVAALLAYKSIHGGELTGAYGIDPFDQLAYLAWIRDEGGHGLASDLWQVTPTAHDYLQPMFLVSGLLWRLGLSVQLSYLIWVPVALLVLYLGFAAYVGRMVPDVGRARSAALLLALFYLSPVLAVATWTGSLSVARRTDLLLVTDDAYAALNLWGFAHTAIAIGLMPIFLLAVEARLRSGPDRRAATVTAALAGAIVSWLHPWQGATLLAVVAGLVALRRPRRRYLSLAVPVIATALPLVYGLVLAHTDPVWRDFQARTTTTGTAPWWALAASLGPLALFSAFGLRRLRADAEWLLALWPAACALVYFALPEYPPHALSGVTLPLAVLAVRGWGQVRLPAAVRPALAAAAILAFTVPAAVSHAQSVGDDFKGSAIDVATRQLLLLSPEQSRAIAYVTSAPAPGPVLAPWFLSLSLPGLTGRQAFAGHVMWQPGTQVADANLFFSPLLRSEGTRRHILQASRARYVIADCTVAPAVHVAIARLAAPVRRFGCVEVYAADGRRYT